MKVIIAGGRNFRNYPCLVKECSNILSPILKKDIPVEIVSGGQVSVDPHTKERFGADYYGEVFAKEADLTVRRFPADWNKWGKGAGHIRNKEMAKYIAPDGMLIAFWDEKSSGTLNMITEARKLKLKVHIIKY